MILIIDDDSAIRSSLSFMLKRAKYEVETASGPKEAIEIIRRTAPQLILMDMNFTLSTSGEEGLTLLRQTRIFRPDVPVILMTAWGSIRLAVQGMQAGAFDFITKQPPVAIQLLEAAKLKSGSAEPNRKKVASLSWDKVKEIAEGKMSDLNAFEIEKAMSMVAGTARSMGITIDGEKPF